LEGVNSPSRLFGNLGEVLEQKTTAKNKKTSAENRREKTNTENNLNAEKQ